MMRARTHPLISPHGNVHGILQISSSLCLDNSPVIGHDHYTSTLLRLRFLFALLLVQPAMHAATMTSTSDFAYEQAATTTSTSDFVYEHALENVQHHVRREQIGLLSTYGALKS
jgi:hypothetical protein